MLGDIQTMPPFSVIIRSPLASWQITTGNAPPLISYSICHSSLSLSSPPGPAPSRGCSEFILSNIGGSDHQISLKIDGGPNWNGISSLVSRRGGLRPPATPSAPTAGGRRPPLRETLRNFVGADIIRPPLARSVSCGRMVSAPTFRNGRAAVDAAFQVAVSLSSVTNRVPDTPSPPPRIRRWSPGGPAGSAAPRSGPRPCRRYSRAGRRL